MNDKPGIAERIGTTINELDIDFSRFSLVGWIVSVVSLVAGGGIAYLACYGMIQRNGLNLAAGMTFCLTMIAVTTIVFLSIRWFSRLAGLTITKRNPVANEGDSANRDTLKRMADAGMDLTSLHTIDFWHLFETKENAENMGRQARQMGFNVVSIEPNDESGGYDVQIQVDLIPTLSAVSNTERKLAAITEQCNGHADGWGVMQEG